MFPLRRLGTAAAVTAALLLTVLGPGLSIVDAATTPVLIDSIAPGIVGGTDGFGMATVLVPKNGYVTYLVRTDSRLRGHHVQIWTNTGKGWKLATTRLVGSDGSVHYLARVTARTGFWAKYADATPSPTSHGRSASVSSDGTTTITVTCSDLGPTGSAVKSIVSRTVATSPHGTVRVVVCANPSTGFSWGMVSLDSTHLVRVGHTVQAASRIGAPGTETWSVRLLNGGVGRTTLVYSQPWRGGEKAAWTLMLTVETS